jgi:hypothetical protein
VAEYLSSKNEVLLGITPIIRAAQLAEIRRIMVRSQPTQTVHKPYLTKKNHKNRLVE